MHNTSVATIINIMTYFFIVVRSSGGPDTSRPIPIIRV